MANRATAKVVDFSNVKDGGNFNKQRVPMGDYVAVITKVEDAVSKKDDIFQYLFTIKLKKFATSGYPYYCKLQENQLWKLRNILVAAGIAVPKRKAKVDPTKAVGKVIGVTMEDSEYEGKAQSEIASVFPASELDVDDIVDDEDQVDAEDEDDDDEDAPIAASVEDEDDDEDEDEEEDDDEEGDEFDSMDRAQLKRYIKKANPDYSVSRSQSDDDLRQVARTINDDDDEEEEDEEPEPPKKAKATKSKTKKKPADVDDDELEELDLEDL